MHSLRRFFISECADAGIPMATVIEWVGHDEMKIVMHYYSLRDEATKEAMSGSRAGDRRASKSGNDSDAVHRAKDSYPDARPRSLRGIWVAGDENPVSLIGNAT